MCDDDIEALTDSLMVLFERTASPSEVLDMLEELNWVISLLNGRAGALDPSTIGTIDCVLEGATQYADSCPGDRAEDICYQVAVVRSHIHPAREAASGAIA